MTVKKTEMWRKYKGKTAEELCCAIREIWEAKYPEYIRLLNEIPNRLIEQVAGKRLIERKRSHNGGRRV